jgi:phosphate/sulfate permease
LNLSGNDKHLLDAYKKQLDHSTKFIPTWVKVAVAIALGLGTMVANHSGLQWVTVRNLLMAWVLTLPVSVALAGALYWLLRNFL